MEINLEGIVGWDITAGDIREKLKEAKGEEVNLIVNSPGGSVYEGIAVYNAIRDFRRAGGKVNALIKGIAMSMATYISLSADTVQVEDNSIYMIHNPWVMTVGGPKEMKKSYEMLESLAKMLANGYEKKTKKEMDAIRSMMDEETYLYGEDIVKAGFADSVIPAGDGAEDEEQALTMAKLALEAMQAKLKEGQEDIGQVAAILKTEVVNQVEKKIDYKETVMDKDIQAELDKKFQEGIMYERSRVQELRGWLETDPDNVKLALVVNEAISDGKKASDVQPKLIKAMQEGKALEGENAPTIRTAEAHTDTQLTEEEMAMMKALNLTEEQYRKVRG
jgi:ATP-dependent protease ClpP protease subunit